MMVHQAIVRDPKQPGGERQAAVLVARERLDHLQENRPRQVLRHFPIGQPEIEIPEDRGGVKLVNLRDGVGIPGLGALD
jgi:hypothetical protein